MRVGAIAFTLLVCILFATAACSSGDDDDTVDVEEPARTTESAESGETVSDGGDEATATAEPEGGVASVHLRGGTLRHVNGKSLHLGNDTLPPEVVLECEIGDDEGTIRLLPNFADIELTWEDGEFHLYWDPDDEDLGVYDDVVTGSVEGATVIVDGTSGDLSAAGLQVSC